MKRLIHQFGDKYCDYICPLLVALAVTAVVVVVGVVGVNTHWFQSDLFAFDTLYVLPDANELGKGLEDEFDGEWVTWEGDGDAQWSAFVVEEGAVTGAFHTGEWWADTLSEDPADHERLVFGFLRALGADKPKSAKAAAGVVAGRAVSGSSCTGPGELEMFTYKSESDGKWTTFFVPVLDPEYEATPSC